MKWGWNDPSDYMILGIEPCLMWCSVRDQIGRLTSTCSFTPIDHLLDSKRQYRNCNPPCCTYGLPSVSREATFALKFLHFIFCGENPGLNVDVAPPIQLWVLVPEDEVKSEPNQQRDWDATFPMRNVTSVERDIRGAFILAHLQTVCKTADTFAKERAGRTWPELPALGFPSEYIPGWYSISWIHCVCERPWMEQRVRWLMNVLYPVRM